MTDRTSTLRLNVDPSQGTAGFATFNRASGTTVAAANKVTGALKTLGIVASSAALVSFGSKSVSSFREYNKALSEVSTLIAGTTEEMEQLDNAAKELAATYGGTAKQQVEAFYQSISAGVGDVTDAHKFLVEANKLATGGVTDIVTAVDALTTVTNAYAAQNLSAAEASDIMFTTVKQGKTTVDELSAALGRVVTISATLDVGFDETSAALAALTSVGINTNEAVTGLQAAFTNVVKPTSEARKIAKILGIEFDSAALSSKGLSVFLNEVAEATGGNIDIMGKLFGSVNAIKTVLALTGTAAEAFENNLQGMEEAAGATNEAFEKVAASLENRYAAAIATLGNKTLEVGETLFQVIVPATELLVRHFDAATLAAGAFATALAFITGHPIIAGITLLGTAVFTVANLLSDSSTHTLELANATNELNVALEIEKTHINDLVADIEVLNLYSLQQRGLKLEEAIARRENIETLHEERIAQIQSSESYIENLGKIATAQRIVTRIQEQILRLQQNSPDSQIGLDQLFENLDYWEGELSSLQAAQTVLNNQIAYSRAEIDHARETVERISAEMNEATSSTQAFADSLKNTGDSAYENVKTVEGFISVLRQEIEAQYESTEARIIARSIKKAEKLGIKESEEAVRELVYQLKAEREELQRINKARERRSQILLEQRRTFANIEADRLDLARASSAARAAEVALREEFGYTFEEMERMFENLPTLATESNEKLVRNTEEAASDMTKIWDNMVRNSQDAFGDLVHSALFERGIKSFKDFGNALLDIWKRTIAEMIAAWATARIFGLPFAGLAGGGSFASNAAASGIGSAVGAGGFLGGGTKAFGLLGTGSFLGSVGPYLPGAGYIAGSGVLGGLSASLSSGFGAFSIGANATLAGGGIGATIGAALPAVGALTLAIGLFTKKVKTLEEGIQLTVTGTDQLANTFKTVRKSRLFGLIRSTSTSTGPVDEGLQSAIDSSVQSLRDSITRGFDVLGLTANFRDFSEDFRISLHGLDEAAREAAINDLFDDIGSSLTQFALASNGLKVASEDAVEAIFKGVSQIAALEDGQVDTVSILQQNLKGFSNDQLKDLLSASRSVGGQGSRDIFLATRDELTTRRSQSREASTVVDILDKAGLIVQGINEFSKPALDLLDTARQAAIDARIAEAIEALGATTENSNEESSNTISGKIDELIQTIQETANLSRLELQRVREALDDRERRTVDA